MKVIKNKGTAIEKNADGETHDYFSLIVQVIDSKSLVDGMSFSQMEDRLRITKALRNSDDKEVTLEDNDYKNLKSYMSSMKWTLPSKHDEEMIEFNNAIKAAKK